jgi:hypothetical protein
LRRKYVRGRVDCESNLGWVGGEGRRLREKVREGVRRERRERKGEKKRRKE